MKWIGITGGVGCGKSSVSAILKKKGFAVIDADEISHEVTGPGSPGLEAILLHFGLDYLNPDGSLDRARLGRLIFGDARRRLELEQLLHPLIRSEVERRKRELVAQGARLAFYDVPLLFEKNMQRDFEVVVVVSTTPELQIERLNKLRSWDPQVIQQRIQSQWPLARKEEKADFVVQNIGSLQDLEQQVASLIDKLKA